MTLTLVKANTDRDLIDLALGKPSTASRQAFRDLYERHANKIYSFLARFLGDEELARDALQETFLRVHRRLSEHDVDASFSSWLYRIARNAGIDLVRRRAKQERLVSAKAERLVPADDDVVEDAARREQIELTRRALDALEPEDRALLIQRHGLNMKQAALAESFAVTERTIRNRLRSAAARLILAVGEAQ